VKFQVLSAVSMKINVFWDVAPYSLIKLTDVSKALTLSIIRAMEAVST
jgi:hypothetical protein